MRAQAVGRAVDQVAVDIHVVEGRPQGSQTTLINLLREIAALGRAHEFALYCNDVELCRSRIGVDGFTYVKTEAGGALKRLLWILPRSLKKRSAKRALWQYISTPFFFGKNVVVIHDVLPLTHPRLFPLGFRVRCQVLFFLSMLAAWRIVVVSEFSGSEISRLFPYFRAKLHLVSNGPSFAEEEYFKVPLVSEKPARSYVLTVGRIEARKNQVMLARAFVAAAVPGVDLIIVGRRDLGFSDPLPNHPAVSVRVGVDDASLISLYRNASLFIFPSEAEGFGIPLLDAVLFGIPVISSDQTAMPEVAGDAAKFFNPLAPNAEMELTRLIAGHFGAAPIAPPSLEQRHTRANRFNWRSSAQSLHDLLQIGSGDFVSPMPQQMDEDVATRP
jgi:glycosyltransferase involved in cell wall biosynthesis